MREIRDSYQEPSLLTQGIRGGVDGRQKLLPDFRNSFYIALAYSALEYRFATRHWISAVSE